MGNQQSSSTTRSTTPTSSPSTSVTTAASHAHREPKAHPPPNAHAHAHAHIPHLPNFHHAARRRESIPTISKVKSQAAPPSASFTNAETRPTSRGRSHTVAPSSALADNLRASVKSAPPAPAPDTMGNEQSKGSSREKGHLPRDATPPQLHPAASPPDKAQRSHVEAAPELHTRPVDVPAVPREESHASRTDDPVSSIDPASASQAEYIVASSSFSRPPRLPLPIEEETHLPGSPILSAQDYSSPVDHNGVEGALPRHASMLSTNTADDEDLGDEFKVPSTSRPTVSTLIEWEGEGERVYVTGTFAGWDRKYRLHRK
jgi:hypothetical protein